MQNDHAMIRDLYAAAEGDSLDLATFASFFADNGYVRNVPAEMDFRGKDISFVASGMAAAFPDIHREIFAIYAMDDVVIVELAIRGTHTGPLVTPAGTLPPTGNPVDIPCCDVFRLKDGKVVSFHCYNAASIMQQQLAGAVHAKEQAS